MAKRNVVKEIRRATRRKLSAEEKIRIVLSLSWVRLVSPDNGLTSMIPLAPRWKLGEGGEPRQKAHVNDLIIAQVEVGEAGRVF